MNIEVSMVQRQELTGKLCHLCGVPRGATSVEWHGMHLYGVKWGAPLRSDSHTYTIQGLHPPDLTIQQSSMVYLSFVVIQENKMWGLL